MDEMTWNYSNTLVSLAPLNGQSTLRALTHACRKDTFVARPALRRTGARTAGCAAGMTASDDACQRLRARHRNAGRRARPRSSLRSEPEVLRSDVQRRQARICDSARNSQRSGTAAAALDVFGLSAAAIALFYGAGLTYGPHTHISMVEYWRSWVVHLWVEGFFEVFATTKNKCNRIASRHPLPVRSNVPTLRH